MKLAVALLRFFPHGGLQRDALATALVARDAGHEVRMYTRRWDGPRPDGIEVCCLASGGFSNHGRARRFGTALADALAPAPADVVIGFDRLPGLDAWFAADPCFAEKLVRERGPLYRASPRARTFAALEAAVAGAASRTRILLVDGRQRAVFQRHYGTDDARFVDLPPGVTADRLPDATAPALRDATRRELAVDDGEQLLLFVGSDFARKGLDRALRSVAALPAAVRGRVRLLAVGDDAAGPARRLARRLGIAERVRVVGGRDDVPALLAAADLLVHPARRENTGTVLVEALAAGLPVLCTAACGYACHVAAAGAGEVVAEPFVQARCDAALARCLAGAGAGGRALAWARAADLGGLHRRILVELEAIAERTP